MLSRSHSICNSLCRMPDKSHSPFIVREAWLCVLVIESCRGSNGKCYDHWRKGMETNMVPCLPQQTTSPRNLSAGHKNVTPALNYSWAAPRGCVCGYVRVGVREGVNTIMTCTSTRKRGVLYVCVNAFETSALHFSAPTSISASDGRGNMWI